MKSASNSTIEMCRFVIMKNEFNSIMDAINFIIQKNGPNDEYLKVQSKLFHRRIYNISATK